jgi:hypothetical protein
MKNSAQPSRETIHDQPQYKIMIILCKPLGFTRPSKHIHRQPIKRQQRIRQYIAVGREEWDEWERGDGIGRTA